MRRLDDYTHLIGGEVREPAPPDDALVRGMARIIVLMSQVTHIAVERSFVRERVLDQKLNEVLMKIAGDGTAVLDRGPDH